MLPKDTQKELVFWTGLQLIEMLKLTKKRNKSSKNSFKKSLL